MANDSSKFRIKESVFRFGAEVRSGDDPREAQLRLIRVGEAVDLENPTTSSDEEHDNANDDAAEGLQEGDDA
jgi:bacterial condensin subunit MukE